MMQQLKIHRHLLTRKLHRKVMHDYGHIHISTIQPFNYPTLLVGQFPAMKKGQNPSTREK